uniref:Nudix hydrolase domain-containing protein n=1 Tax=Rhizochromulina marina TaxID=1034831 RepID=A0A7S2S124_9STRA|mmetsp:Transcript_23691/g.69342  ORF Transcript_23691/g.69342 Transcript_23691/m.69342 type:complete len:254 (+) Transcript_23691:80-841(+)
MIPHFVTGQFVHRRVFLPDYEYGLALDALVKACSDVLVLSQDEASCFLGRRRVEPQPDWWFIGGRARPGETTQDAAARNVRRELGLEVDPARFMPVATFSMVWALRNQPPVENGTADTSTIHVLVLREGEGTAVKLDEAEYRDARFVPLDEVLSGDFHPALQRAVLEFRRTRALSALTESVHHGASEAQVLDASRAFVAAHVAAANSGPAEQSVLFDGEKYAVVGTMPSSSSSSPSPSAAASGGPEAEGGKEL